MGRIASTVTSIRRLRVSESPKAMPNASPMMLPMASPAKAANSVSRVAARMRQQADDAVAEIDRFVEVMGHENHGGTTGRDQREHLVLQSLPRHRVECAERFVHQQRLRLLCQAAGDLQALLHAAGHLGG